MMQILHILAQTDPNIFHEIIEEVKKLYTLIITH